MGRCLPLKECQDGRGNQCNGDSDVCIAEKEANLRREDFLLCGVQVVGRCLGG